MSIMPKKAIPFDKIFKQMEFNMIMGGEVFHNLKIKSKKGSKK